MLVDYVHVYNITSAGPPVGSKITLLADNGLYVTSNNAEPDSAMMADRSQAQAWEQFRVDRESKWDDLASRYKWGLCIQ